MVIVHYSFNSLTDSHGDDVNWVTNLYLRSFNSLTDSHEAEGMEFIVREINTFNSLTDSHRQPVNVQNAVNTNFQFLNGFSLTERANTDNKRRRHLSIPYRILTR